MLRRHRDRRHRTGRNAVKIGPEQIGGFCKTLITHWILARVDVRSLSEQRRITVTLTLIYNKQQQN